MPLQCHEKLINLVILWYCCMMLAIFKFIVYNATNNDVINEYIYI